MKKTLFYATLSLFMLVALTRSTSPTWIQTNWSDSSSYFSLYNYQENIFAQNWDTLYGGRVFLTDDDGENWVQISSADSDIDILSIVMWEGTILAGTWDGFYISTDEGLTWDALTPAGIPEGTPIWSLAMLDTILFAGTQGGIYKSSDNAATWDEIGSGIPGEACITSFISGGGAIFTASSTAGVFRTTNEGANWSEINTGLTDTHISQLVVSGPKLIAVTLNGVFVSEDDGTSWEAYSSDLKNINCFIVVDGQLFAGTDSSGVYRSINNGLTWTPFSSELPPDTRIWSMAADSDTLFAGTDSGVWRIEVDLAEVHWIFLPIINK